MRIDVPKYVHRAVRHPLISGSVIIFVGTNSANFFNFLFSILVARNLSVFDYGVFASLMAFVSLVTIPAGAIVPTVVRFASSYFAHNEYAKARSLFKKLGFFAIGTGLFFSLFAFAGASFVNSFFHIHDVWLITLAGLFILLSYLGTVNTGLLQAKLSFMFIALNSVLGTGLKLMFGYIFLVLGFSVAGVMWAYILPYSVTLLISFYPLRFLFNSSEDSQVHVSSIISFAAPAALIYFGITAFINTDILLVKHFFSPQTAGLYAGISLAGKIIFFITSPISTVMFPLIVQRHTKSERYHHVFFMSLLLTLIPAGIVLILYILFPDSIISILFKNPVYMQMKPYLWLYSLFIIMYALINVIVNFFLSIKRTEIYIPICIGAVSQGIFLWIFHQSLYQVISISLGITTLLAITLVLYYIKLYAQEKRN